MKFVKARSLTKIFDLSDFESDSNKESEKKISNLKTKKNLKHVNFFRYLF